MLQIPREDCDDSWSLSVFCCSMYLLDCSSVLPSSALVMELEAVPLAIWNEDEADMIHSA